MFVMFCGNKIQVYEICKSLHSVFIYVYSVSFRCFIYTCIHSLHCAYTTINSIYCPSHVYLCWLQLFCMINKVQTLVNLDEPKIHFRFHSRKDGTLRSLHHDLKKQLQIHNSTPCFSLTIYALLNNYYQNFAREVT